VSRPAAHEEGARFTSAFVRLSRILCPSRHSPQTQEESQTVCESGVIADAFRRQGWRLLRHHSVPSLWNRRCSTETHSPCVLSRARRRHHPCRCRRQCQTGAAADHLQTPRHCHALPRRVVHTSGWKRPLSTELAPRVSCRGSYSPLCCIMEIRGRGHPPPSWGETSADASTPLGKCRSHEAEVHFPGGRTPQNRESVLLRRKPPSEKPAAWTGGNPVQGFVPAQGLNKRFLVTIPSRCTVPVASGNARQITWCD